MGENQQTKAPLLRCAQRWATRQRAHLHQIFYSMRHAHRAIRQLMAAEEQPLSVHAMSVARSQVESLYAICLIVERPSALEDYLRDGWKKLFIRYITTREECRALPRVADALSKQWELFEKLRDASGVTKLEAETIEADELGRALPAGVKPVKIAQFPTPKGVISNINDPNRKQMLMRLYPEYEFLCGFVHLSPVTEIMMSLLDDRQPFRRSFTSGQVTEIYQKEIVGPAIWLDLISVLQSCSEFTAIYSADIELARACSEGWKPISGNTFIGRIIWELRTKQLLGVIGRV